MRETGSENIATDARESVQVFRDAGAMSHHLLTLDQARESYAQACAANAVAWVPVHSVDDILVGAPAVPVRRYRPGPEGIETPCVIFIHGGGWVMGGIETHDSLCRYLAAHAGATVLSIGYRLAPEHPHPAASEDCRRVLEFVSTHGSELGIDTARIIVGGDSAGGQLAATAVSAYAREVRRPPLAGHVLVYPVTDLTMQGASYATVSGFPLVGDTMRWFIDQYVPDVNARTTADVSPGLHPIPAEHPPTFLVTVENDPLRSEGEDYAEALAAAGVLWRHEHVEGQHHGLLTNAGVIPTGRAVLDQIVDFIRERVGANAPGNEGASEGNQP